MKHIIQRSVLLAGVAGLGFSSGCAALIDADFDKDLRLDGAGGSSDVETGGASSTGGSAGGTTSSGGLSGDGGAAPSGGAASGGAPTGGGDSGGGSTGGAETGGSGGASTGGAASGGASTGGGGALSGDVSINEVFGHDPQFIELFNRGSLEYDLSGHTLVDTNNGQPGLPGKFFGNVTIGPGEYLVVPYDEFQFSITAAESFYLLDRFKNVVSELAYPGDAVVGETSYGRTPDGSSNLQILSEPSPGARNNEP